MTTTKNADLRAPSTDPSIGTAQRSRQEAAVEGRRLIPVIGFVVVLIVLLAVFVPTFYSPMNIANVARQSAAVGVVAVGMTFVIITAGIDLSVGAILAATSVFSGMLLMAGIPAYGVILISLILGALLGSMNAFLVANVKIQPFVATLATSAVIGGLALQSTNGTQVQLDLIGDGMLGFMGSGSVFGVPGPVIIFLATALIGGAILRYTTFGRYVYAIGGSQEAARLSGIRVRPVLFGVYAIAGITAATAGLMYTSRLNVGDPTSGGLIALDAIAAVVIGGTSLFGGSGRIVGTVLGALLLAVLANVLDLLGVSPFMQQTVKGVVIVVAVVVTLLMSKKSRS
ncbi:MAG: rbsC [Microbacteriaceae bacterium]|nr:rbsC [Microbacteriaceae bacterium]